MSEEYKDSFEEEILDSPLVVHKESDASYQETASEMTMNSTHSEEEEDSLPTLERHRFKKKKKNKGPLWVVIAVIAVVAAVLLAVNYSGILNDDKDATEPTTKKSYTTQQANKFEGIITVKGTYIFVEGKEVDGISGLEREIKYLDAGTKFIIQDENADSNLLNQQDGILSTLSKYNIEYEITHIVSSGLMSKYETTAAASTASTTAAPTSEKQTVAASKVKSTAE